MTSNMNVYVLFQNDEPCLLLKDVTLKGAVPVSGYVVNGGWRWVWTGEEVQACDRHSNEIKSRTPVTSICVLPFVNARADWYLYAKAHQSECLQFEYPT